MSALLLKRLVRWCAGAWLALSCCTAMAQPAGAQGEYFLYRVVQGDTLGELARRYTTNYDNWRPLQELNQVENQFSLPIAKLLRIPFSMIPVQDSQARISHVQGEAQIDGQPVAAEQTFSEGQTLITGASGFVTIELSDGSLLSVPPSSEFRLNRLREFQGTGLIDVIVDMQQGSMDGEIAPQQTGVGRFEVRTPVSVTGVRGTRLRVHASDTGTRSEVLHGWANVDATQSVDTMVGAEEGVAVDAAGRSSGTRPLLAAPELSTPVRQGGGWMVEFSSVPGAQSYVVLVATDKLATHLVSRQEVQASPVTVHASGPGTHYVIVRAVGAVGLEGIDARQPFEGQAVLMSSDGGVVSSAWAGPVLVGNYY